MKITPLILVCSILISCADKRNSADTQSANYIFTIDSLKQQIKVQADKEHSDSMVKAISDASAETSIPKYTKSKYKSLEQMFASVITIGSTNEEVIRVQGEPDLILNERNSLCYFYGKSEIKFIDGFVGHIFNIDGNIKYAGDVGQLSIDPDPILSGYAGYIIRRHLDYNCPPK